MWDPVYLPTSQGNQYCCILPSNCMSHGWTKIPISNSAAFWSQKRRRLLENVLVKERNDLWQRFSHFLHRMMYWGESRRFSNELKSTGHIFYYLNSCFAIARPTALWYLCEKKFRLSIRNSHSMWTDHNSYPTKYTYVLGKILTCFFSHVSLWS